MHALIYQPGRSVNQSGRKKAQKWHLIFGSRTAQHADPLMGWIGGASSCNQICLKFDTRKQAVAYAEKQGFSYDVRHPQESAIKIKSYADNFS